MDAPEDTLWTGGRIFTGSGYVDSMLVVGGRVEAVGERRPLLRSRPVGTALRELGGRLVVPGLIDPHLHLGACAEVAEGVDLRGVGSWEEFEARLRAWCARNPEGPVLGGGWDENRLPDGTAPDRTLLDRWVPDRPVLLDRVCRHVAVANSAALERMGLGESSADPPGGRIGRAPDGSLDGRLSENALRAADSLRGAASPRSIAALHRLFEEWAACGLTAVGALSATPEEVAAWQEVPRPCPLGISAYVRLDRWSAGRAPDREGDVRVVGVKAHVDGALGPRTAWLRQPYDDLPGTEGMGLLDASPALERLGQAAAEGMTIALHAIGDRALDEALRLLRTLGRPSGARIEHASLTPPDTFRPLRESGATVVVQPAFRFSDSWLRERLGPRRCRSAYAYRPLYDAGVPLAASSDAPVESVDPWWGMRALTTPGPHGSAPGVLSPEEALGLYTSGAARALGRPELGALRPGARADLVVLATSDLAMAILAGRRAVESTWREGRPVFPGGPPRG